MTATTPAAPTLPTIATSNVMSSSVDEWYGVTVRDLDRAVRCAWLRRGGARAGQRLVRRPPAPDAPRDLAAGTRPARPCRPAGGQPSRVPGGLAAAAPGRLRSVRRRADADGASAAF